jgi:hypothetical protein
MTPYFVALWAAWWLDQLSFLYPSAVWLYPFLLG